MALPIDKNWPVSDAALWSGWPAQLKPHWPSVMGQDANSWQEKWALFWERMRVEEKEAFKTIEANMIAEAKRAAQNIYGDKFEWVRTVELNKWLEMPPGSRLALLKWISDGTGGAVPEELGNLTNRIYYAPIPIFNAAVNGDHTDVDRVYRHLSDTANLVTRTEARIKTDAAQQQQNPGTNTGGQNQNPGSNLGAGGTLPDPVPAKTNAGGGNWLWLLLLAFLGMGGKKK